MKTQTANLAPRNAGQLDQSFGDAGQIRPNLQYGLVKVIALSDEGALTYATEQEKGFTLYRTHPNGAPDLRFGQEGNTGKWQFVDNEDALPSRLLLQKDDKTLIIGISMSATGISSAALTRFNANGSPDLVFGRVIIPLPHDVGGATETDGCLQADGKILIVLTDMFAVSGRVSLLIRLQSNGELDTSFGHEGYVKVESPDNRIGLRSVVIQGEKIVIGGNESNRLALARYDLQGNLDTQFGINGFAFFAVADGPIRMSQLIAQTDQKLACAGAINEAVGMVMRFTADGHPDEQWNGGFPALTDTGYPTRWMSLIQQPDEKIVAAGFNSAEATLIARFSFDGTPDSSFSGGLVSVGSAGGVAYAVTAQSAARLIVGGNAQNGEGRAGPIVYGLYS